MQNKFQNLDRDQASELLKKRLSWIGGSIGILMGLLWAFVSAWLIPAFPRVGSPVFLIFLFLALLLMGFGGMMTGRRYWKNITAKP